MISATSGEFVIVAGKSSLSKGSVRFCSLPPRNCGESLRRAVLSGSRFPDLLGRAAAPHGSAAGVILRNARPWNLKRHDRRFLRKNDQTEATPRRTDAVLIPSLGGKLCMGEKR